MYVTIIFPTVKDSMTMNLYQILVYPVPINRTSLHASQITNVPDYVAFNSESQLYTELSKSTLNKCYKVNKNTLCSFSQTSYPRSYERCSINLVEGDKVKVNEHCDFHFLPDRLAPS